MFFFSVAFFVFFHLFSLLFSYLPRRHIPEARKRCCANITSAIAMMPFPFLEIQGKTWHSFSGI